MKREKFIYLDPIIIPGRYIFTAEATSFLYIVE